MPVHFTGDVDRHAQLMQIAAATQASGRRGCLPEHPGRISTGRRVGTWGVAAGFSLHPLKNINVWGDGGDRRHQRRRDEREAAAAAQSRPDAIATRWRSSATTRGLDSVQAVVGNWLIGQTARHHARAASTTPPITTPGFAGIRQIRVPPRRPKDCRRVYPPLHGVRRAPRRTAQALPRQRHRGENPLPDPALSAGRRCGTSATRPGDFPSPTGSAREVISFPVRPAPQPRAAGLRDRDRARLLLGEIAMRQVPFVDLPAQYAAEKTADPCMRSSACSRAANSSAAARSEVLEAELAGYVGVAHVRRAATRAPMR